MGVQDDLGYHHHRVNAVQRGVQRIASTRAGSWLLSRLLPPIDRFLFRVSAGRWSSPRLLAGLPVLMLTTTGARTGQNRRTPLLGVPFDGDVALIGTNWGQPRTPAWVRNLEASPHASVAYQGRTVDVDARRADQEEKSRILESTHGLYRGYVHYLQRISGREVRVLVLTRSPTSVPG